MQTRITEMFGIEHPIIQGGMHYVGLAEMTDKPFGVNLTFLPSMTQASKLFTSARPCATPSRPSPSAVMPSLSTVSSVAGIRAKTISPTLFFCRASILNTIGFTTRSKKTPNERAVKDRAGDELIGGS